MKDSTDIMKKFIIAFTIISIFYCKQVANAQHNRSVRIKLITNQINPDTAGLFIFPEYLGESLYGFENKTASNQSGVFTFKIPETSYFTYFTLQENFKDPKSRILFQQYISEPGDDVSIRFSNNSYKFSGKGCGKYELLYKLKDTKDWEKAYVDSVESTNPRPLKIGVLDSTSYIDYPEQVKRLMDYFYAKLDYELKILEEYQYIISPLAFQVIKANLVSSCENDIDYDCHFFSTNMKSGGISKALEKTIQGQIWAIYQTSKKLTDHINPKIRIYSTEYSKYLVEHASWGSILKNDGLPWLLRITDLDLRDKLATMYIIRNNKRAKDKNIDIYGIIKTMKPGYFKSILTTFYNDSKPGLPAFNFSLSDTSGRMINLDNFRGKTVVIDFWFTGCQGCASQAPHIKAIEDSLKNNSSIVFMTISVDKDINKWKKSVKSEIYSSHTSTNLFTNGLAELHPMIKYYKFMGFPQLLIIDPKGNVVSKSPAKPVDKKTENEFISLLLSIK